MAVKKTSPKKKVSNSKKEVKVVNSKKTVSARTKKNTQTNKAPKTEQFDLTLQKISQIIQERAYFIWEQMGRPEGKAEEIWLQAEKEELLRIFNKQK